MTKTRQLIPSFSYEIILTSYDGFFVSDGQEAHHFSFPPDLKLLEKKSHQDFLDVQKYIPVIETVDSTSHLEALLSYLEEERKNHKQILDFILTPKK